MNETTQDVIEFLGNPELDFGGDPLDVELLDDPESLRQRVDDLLDAAPSAIIETLKGRDLRARLDEADWPAIAHEFRTRLNMAAGFFDADSQTHNNT